MLVETLADWKTFSTRSLQAYCKLSCLENLFDVESSSWLQPRRKGFPTKSNRLEDSFVEKFPTSQGSKQLEDLSKKFSNKPRLQPARGLDVEKVLLLNNVAAGWRNLRRKGFPIRQGVLKLVGKPFPQAGWNLSWLENFSNEDSSRWLQHWLI